MGIRTLIVMLVASILLIAYLATRDTYSLFLPGLSRARC